MDSKTDSVSESVPGQGATTHLATAASLKNAGFVTTEKEQERFVARLLQKLYYRTEVPVDRRLMFGAGALLCALSGLYLLVRGEQGGAIIFAAAGGMHILSFWSAHMSKRQRSHAQGESHPEAAFLDDDGGLRPILEDGEQVLRSSPADGPVQKYAKHMAGLFQLGWGLLLGGLPVASAIRHLDSFATYALLVIATFMGTLVFGRGVRSMFGIRPIQQLVLTNQRVVAIAEPGAAMSVPLEHLRVRPTVIGRESGRATVAFEMRPLSSVTPLPIMGILGLHDVSEEEAKDWARLAMDARLLRLRKNLME